MMKRFIFSAVLIMACLITAQAQKFALIDMEYILKQIPAYEQANQKLETLSKQWQSEVEAKGKEAKALYESYQSTASKMTAVQKTAKEDAIVAKEKEAAELRKKYFGPEGEIMKKREELIGPIQDAVYDAVKTVAVQNGYDVIFDRASAQSMIFASPRIDVSDVVLQVLNKSK